MNNFNGSKPNINVDNKNKRKFIFWKKSSMELLNKAEDVMLSNVKCNLDKYYVNVLDKSAHLWTVAANKSNNKTIPLVMVHGYGTGVGMWCLNYDDLSNNRSVYTFDLLGFGKSSRIVFPKSADMVEDKFVESIEEWRKQENLEKFHLLGHSFGGFIVGCYALKYPNRVQSLIFADPWGFPLHDNKKPSNNGFIQWCKSVTRLFKYSMYKSAEQKLIPQTRSSWVDDLLQAFGPFSPFSIMRASGPWGPKLLESFKKEYVEFFRKTHDNEGYMVFHYLYQCNSFQPSGEKAFSRINKSLSHQCTPMIIRIAGLRPGMPITFIYGSKSWIDANSGFKAKSKLPSNDVAVYVLQNAGHHVYAEQPKEFNRVVNERCSSND